MFSYSISGGTTENGCFANYMEIVYDPGSDLGNTIPFTVYYLTDGTNGFQYLLRENATEDTYFDGSGTVVVTKNTDLGESVYTYRGALSTATQTWMQANLGRMLYVSFSVTNNTMSDTDTYSAKVAIEHEMWDNINKKLTWLRNDIENVVFPRLTVLRNQIEWLTDDAENVIFPRLKRLLQLAGENLLIDNFSYDNAGNITSLRLRAFDERTNTNNATIDATSYEVGEEFNIDVTQTHNLPRNVRTSHLSRPDVEATDSDATANNITSAVNAPGNTGTWPDYTDSATANNVTEQGFAPGNNTTGEESDVWD